MSVTYHEDGQVMRDTNIADGQQFYLTNGQGCDTIWFRNAKAAKRALDQDGVVTGRDLHDCKKCACHYSVDEARFKKYPMGACGAKKRAYAKKFEEGS